jgi:hypothetical protein
MITPKLASSQNVDDPKVCANVERETSELLEEAYRWVRRYIILSDQQAVILAVWVLHTYTYESAEVAVYIHVTAPERECGKSNLMRALVAIAANPIRSGGISAAALVRVIDSTRPTVFLDEMDAQLGGDKEFAETIRGILNEGFEKGGVYHKCIGKNHDLKDFQVYGPKCFAGIGKLPETVASRSIPIEMRRKLPGEHVLPMRSREVKESSAPIRAQFAAWKDSKVADQLAQIRPGSIDALGDRQNDVAEPLLCIATLAGSAWLQRLSDALVMVLGAGQDENVSVGVNLLISIRDAFDELGVDRLPSKSLASQLCEMEGKPWAEWRGKGLTANNLAQQLKRYHIYPRKIRTGTEATVQGYMREFFEDAWERYCSSPVSPAVSNGTTEQPVSSLGETHLSKWNTNGTQMEQEQTRVPFPPNVPPCSVSVLFPKIGSIPHEQRIVPTVPVQIEGSAETDSDLLEHLI